MHTWIFYNLRPFEHCYAARELSFADCCRSSSCSFASAAGSAGSSPWRIYHLAIYLFCVRKLAILTPSLVREWSTQRVEISIMKNFVYCLANYHLCSWLFLSFVAKLWEQRTKFLHFACVSFTQYCNWMKICIELTIIKIIQNLKNLHVTATLDKLCWKMPKTWNYNLNTYRISVNTPIPPFNVGKW